MLDQSDQSQYTPLYEKIGETNYQILTFCKEDIEVAIGNCNFNKAIGIDWFSGKIMKKDNDVRRKLVEIMLKWLKSC